MLYLLGNKAQEGRTQRREWVELGVIRGDNLVYLRVEARSPLPVPPFPSSPPQLSLSLWIFTQVWNQCSLSSPPFWCSSSRTGVLTLEEGRREDTWLTLGDPLPSTRHWAGCFPPSIPHSHPPPGLLYYNPPRALALVAHPRKVPQPRGSTTGVIWRQDGGVHWETELHQTWESTGVTMSLAGGTEVPSEPQVISMESPQVCLCSKVIHCHPWNPNPWFSITIITRLQTAKLTYWEIKQFIQNAISR